MKKPILWQLDLSIQFIRKIAPELSAAPKKVFSLGTFFRDEIYRFPVSTFLDRVMYMYIFLLQKPEIVRQVLLFTRSEE